MVLRYAFVVVSVLNFLHNFHVFCDENCAENPVFTPSRLVVKFGDPTSATCLVCQHNCTSEEFGLEKSVGELEPNGTTILWRVDNLTVWDLTPKCYYTDSDDNQCVTKLPVTVYQPPKSVKLSFLDHSGPMFAGRQYTLQCKVQEVAPIELLNVTFYRGQTPLQSLQSSSTTKEPVNETFTLNITATKEDDGGLYWCEAELDLGAEGPQPPPVVTSEKVNATVYYKPQLKEKPHPENITVTEGDSLQLNCFAEGNPSPSYTWMHPSTSPSSSGSTLSIESVMSADAGQYSCSVSNSEGMVTKEFTVEVKENYTVIIIIIVVAVLIVLAVIAVCVWRYMYKPYRMGRYNLKDVFQLGNRHQHVAVPVGE